MKYGGKDSQYLYNEEFVSYIASSIVEFTPMVIVLFSHNTAMKKKMMILIMLMMIMPYIMRHCL